MEQAVELTEEINQLFGKAVDPDKYITKQHLWLHKLA